MNDHVPMSVVAGLAFACAAAFVGAAFRIASRRSLVERGAVREVRWGAAHAVGVLVLFILAQVAADFAYRATGRRGTDSPDSFAGLVGFIYLFDIPVLLVLFMLAGKGGSATEALGLAAKRRVRSFLTGLWLFGLFYPLQMAYMLLVQKTWQALFNREYPQQAAARFLIDAGPFAFAVLALFLAVAVPVVEELIFRGFVQNGIERSFGPLAGTAGAALLFTIVHGADGALLVFPVAVALSLVYYRTRNLLICMGFHFGVNLTAVILALSVKPA